MCNSIRNSIDSLAPVAVAMVSLGEKLFALATNQTIFLQIRWIASLGTYDLAANRNMCGFARMTLAG